MAGEFEEVRPPPTRTCAHYAERAQAAEVLGRVEFVTLRGVQVERLRVLVCDGCVENMHHWLAFRL